MMSEVQGTLEFSVELHKFHNVDLFQRGFYQVRAGLKVSPRVPHRLVVTTGENTGECSFSSAGVYDGTVFSHIFQILYRNEEIAVNDCMIFKVHLLLDGEKVEEALSEVEFQLKLDLHFTDNEQQLAEIATVPMISSRTLSLHFHPRRGLHHHVPVMFDYFHLSVISISIHASLVALHQPLISFARTGKGSWLGKGSPESGSDPSAMSVESLMFGAGYCKPVVSEGSFYVPSENCLQRAYTWHRRLCRLLLVAHQSLHTYYTALTKEIPQLQQKPLDSEVLRVEETLNQLTIELQLQEGHEKVAEQISRDVSQLCSQLDALWSRFLEAAVLNPHILSYLTQEHHTLRVRRFSEAYFFTEHPKETSLTFQEDLINRHGQIASEVRISDYLNKMPPLPVECLDIDGDWNSLPIIFEDRYVECPQTELLSHMPMVASINKQTTSDPSVMPANRTRQGARSPAIPQEPLDSDDCMDLPTYVSLIAEQSRSSTDRLSPASLISHEKSPEASQTSAEQVEEPEKQAQVEESSSQRYITVRPSDADPHRGEAVLVLSSHHNRLFDCITSNSTDESPVHHVKETTQLCDASQVLENNNSGENEYNEEETDVAMPLSHSMDDETEDVPLICLPTTYPHPVTPLFTGELRKEVTHRGLVSSKIMKRSSSVISDSGIESEPSSVVWPVEAVLRGRPPLDFSSEREIPQQMVHLHPVHRSSLEGLQMESNGSLPSGGIQASLTSIISLPYEEDQQQRQLSKLTKSVSAPQISSPDDTEEGRLMLEQELGNKNLTQCQDSSRISCSSLMSNQDQEQCETSTLDMSSASSYGRVLKETTSSEHSNVPESHRMDSVLSDVPEVLRLQLPVEARHVNESAVTGSQRENINYHTDSNGRSESVCDVRLFEVKATPCSCRDEARVHKRAADRESVNNGAECQSSHENELLGVEDQATQMPLNPTAPQSQDSGDIQQIPNNSNTVPRPSDLAGLTITDVALPSELSGISASEEEPLDCQAKPSKIPNSGLAFMNKKMVEVVNMSVSCAPTCLPFSSALRDSPSVSGISARQATSPITHQPLGSFGIISSSSFNPLSMDCETNERMINFYKAKEELIKELSFQASLYSDLPLLASDLPYFPPEEDDEEFDDGIHLVVCVHGLDGNSADLRLVKTFIELGLPGSRLDFLMSERNQTDTFADFDTMTDRLLDEIIQHIQLYNLTIGRISFIGHSLGNIIIRSVLTRPRFRCYLPKLHTFLSLSGPHLGTLYNNSTLVSTGLWLMQKLKKSGSLLQLTFRDHVDPRKTFLYLLSQKPGLQFFKNVVLVASPQDRYVPFHSARIEMCKTALKDRTTGPVYTEMINNLLKPLVEAKECQLIRQNVFHALPNTANTLIGRAAHIAVLDSELFLEKFFLVAGLNYFK